MITSLVTVIINNYDHIKAWKGGGIPNLNLTHPSTYTIVTKQPRLSLCSDFSTAYGGAQEQG